MLRWSSIARHCPRRKGWPGEVPRRGAGNPGRTSARLGQATGRVWIGCAGGSWRRRSAGVPPGWPPWPARARRPWGGGATARQDLRCTRAIGARTPSLAVAATMHNFSVASLVALSQHSEGFEWMLLDAIARDRLLAASAFAEGLSGQGIWRRRCARCATATVDGASPVARSHAVCRGQPTSSPRAWRCASPARNPNWVSR